MVTKKPKKCSPSRSWDPYPSCTDAGLTVELEPGWSYIPIRYIKAMCRKRGAAFTKRFSELSGRETQSSKGPYPYNVEAVLIHMLTEQLVGAQLRWD